MRLGDEDVPNVLIYERFDSTCTSSPWGEVTKDKVDLYLRQVFNGVQAVHAAGYAHTEIKLENVYMNHEDPKFALGNFEASQPLDLEITEADGYFYSRPFKNLPWYRSEDGKIHPVLINTKFDGDYVSMTALDNWAFLLSLVEVCKQVQEDDMSCMNIIEGDSEAKVRGNPATLSLRNVLHRFFGGIGCKYLDHKFEYTHSDGLGGEIAGKWNYGGVVCDSEEVMKALLVLLSRDYAVQKVIHDVLSSSS